ncbi:MFS transporter [Chloroflexota bacterium]
MKFKNVYFGRIVVFAASSIMIVYSITMHSRGIFLTSLVDWFNWNSGDISGAYSIGFIMMGLLSPISGRLTDKFGPRIIITFLGLLVGGGLILMSLVTSIIHVYLIWIFMIGIGGSCCFIPIVSTLTKWFTEKRGLVIGITFAGFSVGGIIWPPLVERLIANVGWQSTYIVIGIITLIIITALAQLIKQNPQEIGLTPPTVKVTVESTAQIPKQTTIGLTFTKAIRKAPYWLIWLIRFCSIFVFQLILVHIFPHAIDIGFSEVTAALIISIISISTTASRLLTGFIGDRIGHRLTLFLSATVLVLSLVGLVYVKELWHFYVFASFFGLAWGGAGVTQVALIAEFFESRSLGAIMGSLEIALAFGGGIGVFIGGIIFDTTGNYNMAFVICIIQAILVIISSLILMRYKHKKAVS